MENHLLSFYLNLTPRQRDVVYWVSLGLSNKEVAAELHVERCVVAEHLTNIYQMMALLDTMADRERINRNVLIHVFTVFFHQHTALLSLEQTKAG